MSTIATTNPCPSRISALAVAVLIPCKNEEATIALVIAAFRTALPDAQIWVCDNLSTDGTAIEAERAGAIVVREPRAGKGNAVRRLFSCVIADAYILVDGDATYEASGALQMLDTLSRERLDMVVGRRLTADPDRTDAYRRGHQWGNRMFALAVTHLFGYALDDIFSGYRVFSARFVRCFPALSSGFEIEIELTVHSLDLGLPIAEIPTPYRNRPAGSQSKLNTLADGFRIALTLAHLYEQARPARFFGLIGLLLAFASLGLGIPVVSEYFHTGLVPRFPTAILASAIMLVAMLTSPAACCSIALAEVERKQNGSPI